MALARLWRLGDKGGFEAGDGLKLAGTDCVQEGRYQAAEVSSQDLNQIQAARSVALIFQAISRFIDPTLIEQNLEGIRTQPTCNLDVPFG